MQAVAFLTSLNVPASHGWQSAAAVAVLFGWYVPAGQAWHVVGSGAPSASLQNPRPHGSHPLSCDDVLPPLPNLPAGQERQAASASAPVAFENVPRLHGLHAANTGPCAPVRA